MRITVPDDSVAILLPIQLAEELYNLCSTIRKTKRLKIEPPIHAIAGDIMLAVLASEAITILPRKES